jgi:hypothetical protein
MPGLIDYKEETQTELLRDISDYDVREQGYVFGEISKSEAVDKYEKKWKRGRNDQ